MKDLFRGELVRITAEEPDVAAKAEAQWQRDSEFIRLADNEPILFSSKKKIQGDVEKRFEKESEPDRYSFNVRALADDKLIGFFQLTVELIHGEAWVGIGIGERDFWSKGYGTDMMKVCLRYAFLELGVERVSLGVLGYNTRALRSYEKAGFQLEGHTRMDVMREGKRSDTLWMGILREEWMASQGENQ